MLDSITLNLQPCEFEIMDYEAFTPSAKPIFIPPYYPMRRGGMSCVNNPTQADTRRFGYMPRLTLYKRPAESSFRIGLRVDISLPKLKYGNNFDELTDADLPYLCSKLAQQMERMGVKVTSVTLQKAEVSSVHYSKNIPLTDYTRCSMVIREVVKSSVGRQLDSVNINYQNDGSAVKLHSNSHEVILYDKLRDLERGKISDKRAIEKDNAVQLSLLDKPFPKPFEVLRLEARLGTRQKIRALLKKLGMERSLTFESLYSSALAKAVLFDYWGMMTADMPVLAASGFPSGELYDAIYQNEPGVKPGNVLQKVGALAIIHKEGMNGLRERMESHGTTRTWYRVKHGLNNLTLTSHMKYNAVQMAERHLQAFIPLRLTDYRGKSD